MAWTEWPKKFSRLLHFVEAKGEYSGTAVADPIPPKLTALQTSVQAQIDSVDAYILANGDTEGALAAISTALGVIKNTNIAEVITDYGDKPTDQDVCDVMDKVHADLLAAMDATHDQPDARCGALGWYYKSQDTGSAADATVKKLCPSCQATGYLLSGTSNTPVQTFPVTDEYSEELDQA